MSNTFFSTREIEGRSKWFELNKREILLGKKAVVFTLDEFDGVDFFMTAYTTNTRSIGEIKTVHRPYSKYPNFQIDYSKAKGVQEKAKAENSIPYVVGFFDDCTIVWDISNIDLEERRYIQYCTSTTADYQKGKKKKEEVWLLKEEAIYTGKTFN